MTGLDAKSHQPSQDRFSRYIIFKIHWAHSALVSLNTYHFFMRCQNFSNQRNVLFDELISNNLKIVKMSENEMVWVLLFGNKSFSKYMNFRIITSSVRFIKDSKGFVESLSSFERNLFDIFSRRK